MALTIAEYLTKIKDKKSGGGECAHLATEMLRVTGNDFTRTDGVDKLDYVWSSNRIATYLKGNIPSGVKYRVGDIIQFVNAKFKFDADKKVKHHTQVVGKVDDNGKITKIYDQNIGSERKVFYRDAYDLSKLTDGKVTVYRPVKRPDEGRLEFTVRNETSKDIDCEIVKGNSTSSFKLTAKDTTGCYTARWISASTTDKIKLKVGTASVTLSQAGGYEVYTQAGKLAIRKLSV